MHVGALVAQGVSIHARSESDLRYFGPWTQLPDLIQISFRLFVWSNPRMIQVRTEKCLVRDLNETCFLPDGI
jgi:hypothetical protein